MTDLATSPDETADMRNHVVDTLVDDGAITSPAVEAAMRCIPRHRFAPDAAPEAAYRTYHALVTKRNGDGVAISSVSAPQIHAFQLEQAQLSPGAQVLEIGSGGLNAAYLAELVGPTGEVTTVDIDQEVTDRAAALLADNGYPQVRVLHADADDGFPEHGPYDAIIVTVGAWEIPPAWITQLVPGGRLVVPLRMRNLSRSIGFQRFADHLESHTMRVCGFVTMQGAGAHEEPPLLVTGTNEIQLHFDEPPPAGADLVRGAVRWPRTELATGVTVSRTENIGTLQLYLASNLPGFCVMTVDEDLDTGLVSPRNPPYSPAAVQDGNLAYLTTRPTEDDHRTFDVHALGPQAKTFAEKMAGLVRTWDTRYRGGPGPSICVHPAGTPDEQLPRGTVIRKARSTITLSWPE